MALNAKEKLFFCAHCGEEEPRWMGFCHACGIQEPLEEKLVRSGRQVGWLKNEKTEPVELSSVSPQSMPRIATSDNELNRVLGGGLVPGSVVLLAGDPGIGKSTLLLQIAASLASGIAQDENRRVLYVSGEESPGQVWMRAQRLSMKGKGIYLLGETSLHAILDTLDAMQINAVIIDSIQTIYSEELSAVPGSLSQIRECARQMLTWGKTHNVPILLAGHVTKEGEIAGPRVLEHMVDVVLHLEGDGMGAFRVLRGVKNRFGSTDEVAVYQMEENGLRIVDDPSRALLAHRRTTPIGSVVVPVIQGTRTLLVEVQALTSPSYGPIPRRVANGLDLSRVLMIAAVLDRRVGLRLSGQDIIVNVVGGIRLDEPAADLGIALAIASSVRGVPVKETLVAIGEIGLSGEVRPIPQFKRRLQEAERLGFELAVLRGDHNTLSNRSMQVYEIDSVAEALEHSFLGQNRINNRTKEKRISVTGGQFDG